MVLEWRTLAVQVAPGRWCGPSRAGPPHASATRKICCGMVGVPTLGIGQCMLPDLPSAWKRRLPTGSHPADPVLGPKRLVFPRMHLA